VLELSDGFGLDLSDALAGDLRNPADLFERVGVAVADAVPQLDDLALAVGQRLEDDVDPVLEHGIAVPHTVANCVEEVIGALGISAKGIPFESRDDQPAKLVILLLIPQGAFQRHVRTLAGIARLGANPELRNQLFDAKSPADVMDVLVRADSLHGD